MIPPARLKADQSLEPAERRRGRGPWIQLFTSAAFEWNVYDLPITNLPTALDGFRIVHLSDVHLRTRWDPAYDKLFEILHTDPPDIVLFGGDMVEHQFDFRVSLPTMQRFLAGLTSRMGTYSILGNHDTDLLGTAFERFGATLIHRRFMRIATGAAHDAPTLELIGLSGVLRPDIHDGFLNLIPPRSDNALRIAVTHFPDFMLKLLDAGAKPDIILAGHTHGGQACLPGGVAILQHDSLPRPYYKGVHRFGDTWLVVNRGFGYATYEFRVFCPSEVIELRLRCGDRAR